MLIFLTITVAWFALGVFFAPRAAAHGYKHCPYLYEDMRKDSAKAWYWLTMFMGPIMLGIMFTRRYLIEPAKGNANSRLDQALIRHDSEYREKHLKEQESRIRRLEAENARLTKDILR